MISKDKEGHDEGAEGRLRTKHKITPPHTYSWGTCDIPQALQAAQGQRKGENPWLANRDHSHAGQESQTVYQCLSKL